MRRNNYYLQALREDPISMAGHIGGPLSIVVGAGLSFYLSLTLNDYPSTNPELISDLLRFGSGIAAMAIGGIVSYTSVNRARNLAVDLAVRDREVALNHQVDEPGIEQQPELRDVNVRQPDDVAVIVADLPIAPQPQNPPVVALPPQQQLEPNRNVTPVVATDLEQRPKTPETSRS